MAKPLKDTVQLLKNQLKESTLSGAYLFVGEEEYLKQYYLREIREKLIPEEASLFDDIRLSGGDGGIAELPDRLAAAAMTPPVMCEHKLVEIHETDFEALKKTENKKTLGALCQVLEACKNDKSCVVIFVCTSAEFPTGYKWDATPLYRALSAVAEIVCFSLQTPQKLYPWCLRHFTKEKIEVSAEALTALVNRTGRSMQLLDCEIDKLCLYAHAAGKTEITADDVKHITVLSEESRAFGLTDALKRRDVASALKEYRMLRFAKAEPTLLFAQISGLVTDMWKLRAARDAGMNPPQIASAFHMHEFVVGSVIQASAGFSPAELGALLSQCVDTDHQLKYSAVNDDVVLERLITSFGK